MDFIDTLVEPQLCSSVFFDNLMIEKVVGSGAFGEASLAKDTTTGKTYIIKSMDIDKLVSMNYTMTRIRDEIMNHFAISLRDCPNVCNIVCVNRSAKRINIVQEYCGKELANYILHRDTEPEFFYTNREAKKWTEQLLLALECIHELDLAHFDIKPANLLIDDNGDLKVIDFGVSQHRSQYEKGENLGGTPGYIPLEALANKRFDYRNDSYAAGQTIKQLWNTLREPKPEHINNLIKALTTDYDSIPTIKQALHMFNPDKYPLRVIQPAVKPYSPLNYDLTLFDEKVEEAIQEDIELGMIDPDRADMEEERKSARKLVYRGLAERNAILSPEIVRKYPDILEE